ncbi:hypothetical protein BIWAKO_05858 [Bosea sp. BIWAKO-01]|nr:hypothetical protein BIWAKO_05858 [Bosea sp. BIWAKO-01]
MIRKSIGPKNGLRFSGKADANTGGQVIGPDTISGPMT